MSFASTLSLYMSKINEIIDMFNRDVDGVDISLEHVDKVLFYRHIALMDRQKQKTRHEGGFFVFGWETRIRT